MRFLESVELKKTACDPQQIYWHDMIIEILYKSRVCVCVFNIKLS